MLNQLIIGNGIICDEGSFREVPSGVPNDLSLL